jgi:Tfp pilus assembly PilM family ATPase
MANKMARWMFSPSSTLALDIGSKYIKAMQFEQSGGVPALHVAAIAPVPEGAIENGIIANRAAVVAI